MGVHASGLNVLGLPRDERVVNICLLVGGHGWLVVGWGQGGHVRYACWWVHAGCTAGATEG